MAEIKTFKDLYEFLQNDLDFSIWLSEKNWNGKEKQESVLRLFSSLGLIKKLNNFDICKGNFNKQTIKKIESYREIFYDGDKEIMLNDKGDASDLTGINKNNILATTSKNLKKYTVGSLDIDKILTNFQKYKDNFSLTLCICIPDIEQYRNMKKNIENTNKDLLDIINKEDTIIIDQNDLYQAYKLFRAKFGKIPINDILENNKKPIIFKFHQKLSMYKAIELKLKNKKIKEILFGHLPRSGKSYIIAGCIIVNDKIKKNKNYLFITTAPNETLSQQYQIFNDSFELNNFNVMIVNGQNKNKPKNNINNIILCSKQFLQNKKIKWLNEMDFEMRFIDESHNGATTEISKGILNQYGKNSFTVQITATYSKPANTFNIRKEYQILWDMEDINLCQKINKDNLKRLIQKHGHLVEKIIKNYTFEDIQEEYSKYPKLWTITLDLNEDFVNKINQRTIDNDYGWSNKACFLLNDDKTGFQNKEKNLDLWYQIFGKYDEYGILDNKYKNNSMQKIKNICRKQKSRFFDTPLAIMAFLPQDNINDVSQASKKLLEDNKVIPDFDILIINSKTTNNSKKLVIEAKEKAKISGKKGVLVLSGRQCSLGVSLNFCDIVLLLNNNKSFDMLFQMMFRSMTEAKNKTCGFVVDLNIHRLIQNVIVEYASNIKPELQPIEAVKYILNERLININSDAVMKTSEGLSKIIYDIYKTDINGALDHSLNKLRFKFIDLDKDDKKFLLNIFGNSNSKKIKEEKEKKEQIQEGIEKIKEESEEKAIKEKEEIKEEFNFMDKLRHIIPLTCLLTIHNSETEFHLMLDIIKNSHYLSKIFIEQIKTWWQKKIDNKSIENFIQLYKKYIMKDKETKQIIRTVKELFKESINDRDKLSQLVDKYFIPTEIEKKSNAEVSTPYKIRNEMLDTISLDFWKELRKVFEPCCGKGGFIIDIINRFMIGLKDKIKDEKERYKVIVEECLYFSDISETNIFISKLLVDSNDEFNLNYNLGNTLELDIKEKWGIDGFDAVIGNPPYQTDPSKPNSKPLYNKFIEKYIDECKYLLFVVPSRWFVGGKGLDKFRLFMMKRKDIVLIKHEDDATKWFGKSIEIKGGVNYFLKDTNYEGECKFNDISYDLSKYDCVIKPKYHKVIDIVTGVKCIDKLYMGRYFGIETNDKRFNNNGNIKCYVSSLKSNDRCKYIDNYEFNEKNTFWKVITARAAHKGFSGFGEKFIGKPNEVHTGSYISFKVNNEEEAKSLLSYLNTQFANYMLSIRKISQDISENTCKWIPLVPLDRIWNNKSIYKYFKLTKEEIKLIEENVD